MPIRPAPRGVEDESVDRGGNPRAEGLPEAAGRGPWCGVQRDSRDVLSSPTHRQGGEHRPAEPQATHRRRGPAVCDVFVGAYPRSLPAVVQLPSVIHLPVQTSREAAPASVVVEPELTFPSSPRLPPPPAVNREEVIGEFFEFLGRADAAATALEARAAVRRAERRLAVRQLAASRAYAAHSLHVRVARSETTGARVSRAPTRARSARRRAPAPVQGALKASAPVGRAGASVRRAVAPRVPRRRSGIREAIRVAVGVAALFLLVNSLASVSRLGTVARNLRATARAGAGALVAGYGALLTADAQTGATDFAEARAAFKRAARDLQQSTTVIQRIAGRLDPLGRLPAAQELLSIGERAAALGTATASLVQSFQDSQEPLTETLEAWRPRLESAHGELREVVASLTRVAGAGLPEDDAVALAKMTEGLRTLENGLAAFLRSQRVVLELLGSRHDRQYLILFQNQRELRPSGGFIGSFALVDVSRGEVRKVQVDTIYNPDGQLKDFLVPPAPLQKITDRWFARDANWFADFRHSADKVAHLFERSGGPTVDGVLAVTPTVLEDLLRVTGPIPMPEYEVTVAAANAPEVIQRLTTYEYDREQNEPKAFIADLLPEVLARVATLPKARLGDVVDVFANALKKKQVLVFFRDEEAEEAVVSLGWGGALPSLPPPTASAFTDHLARVEANIGGHKTDTLIEQSVDYDVTVGSDGAWTSTLVVTRHHRGPKSGTPGLPSDEDPARKPNVVYERTFVPPGSKLLEARGFLRPEDVPAPFRGERPYETFERDADLAALEGAERPHESGLTVGTESGLTTFGGWVVTAPEETTVTVISYRLPFALPAPSLLASILRYELLVTQQPGHLPVLTRAALRLPEGFRLAWTGPASGVTLSGERRGTYTAVVDRDLAWGAVIEEK